MLLLICSCANGQDLTLTLSQLHPTQPVISYDQVAKKIGKYQKKHERFTDDLNELPRKTVVKGPHNQYYLTDGHHTFSAMVEYSPEGGKQEVVVNLVADKSTLSEPAFWQWLEQTHQSWPFDASDSRVAYADMPAHVGRQFMADDPVRGAMYFLRNKYLQKPDNPIPFLEFYWARYIRQHLNFTVPEVRSELTDLFWLQQVASLIAATPDNTVIGPDGQTAREMGKMPMTEYSLPVLETPSYSSEEKRWDAVVEIPAGTTAKWQINKKSKDVSLEWEFANGQPRRVNYLGYPANYGAIPGTLSDVRHGGDGDPLDVLILGTPLPRGSEIGVRIIGRMQMTDNGETDDKYIAVVPEDKVFGQLRSVTALNNAFPAVTDIFASWFSHYKGDDNTVTVHGFDDQHP